MVERPKIPTLPPPLADVGGYDHVPVAEVIFEPVNKYKKEIITNIRRIENKVCLGETIKNFEIIEIDWDQHLKEHKENLEAEITLRENRIQRKEIKEKSWQLYRECKEFLEENEKDWEQRRIERELERKKTERIEIARAKQEK